MAGRVRNTHGMTRSHQQSGRPSSQRRPALQKLVQRKTDACSARTHSTPGQQGPIRSLPEKDQFEACPAKASLSLSGKDSFKACPTKATSKPVGCLSSKGPVTACPAKYEAFAPCKGFHPVEMPLVEDFSVSTSRPSRSDCRHCCQFIRLGRLSLLNV